MVEAHYAGCILGRAVPSERVVWVMVGLVK